MKTVKQTDTFLKWLKKLKDIQGKVSILRRLERLKENNFGDYKSISADLWELRITTGPGYRIYYTKKEMRLSSCLLVEISHLKVMTLKKQKNY
jgi:putative addiction module killer protein